VQIRVNPWLITPPTPFYPQTQQPQLENLRLIFCAFCAFLWPTTNFNQMRRGGKKLSNIFNRFYTFFSLFYTFFQIFPNFSTTFDVFKHEHARLMRKSAPKNAG
jgi:hypothetical protein